MIPIVCQNHIGTEYCSARYDVLCETIVEHAVKTMIDFYDKTFGGYFALLNYAEFEKAYVEKYHAPLRYRWFFENMWHDSTEDEELTEIIVSEYNAYVNDLGHSPRHGRRTSDQVEYISS